MVGDSMGWYGKVWNGMRRYGTVWGGMGWSGDGMGMVWDGWGMVWDGIGWYGRLWDRYYWNIVAIIFHIILLQVNSIQGFLSFFRKNN